MIKYFYKEYILGNVEKDVLYRVHKDIVRKYKL